MKYKDLINMGWVSPVFFSQSEVNEDTTIDYVCHSFVWDVETRDQGERVLTYSHTQQNGHKLQWGETCV